MTKQEELNNILENMKKCALDDDWEVAHNDADNLLLDVIETLVLPKYREIVNQIIHEYENTGKWYA